jgi:hypothetical protein
MGIHKVPTHDGTYTVYRQDEVVGCGLSLHLADGLITELLRQGARGGTRGFDRVGRLRPRRQHLAERTGC